jgi:polyisoprenyl-phosphate glycosyltransferase
METKSRGVALSVVVPVYGGNEILVELVRQVEDVARGLMKLEDRFELLFVDDRGPEDNWAVIRELALSKPHVKGIRLRKNVGQHNAVLTGLRFATGAVVVVMDDDLQHSPYDIPELYKKITDGYDVCYASFAERRHARWKVVGSYINDRVATFLLRKPSGLYLSPFKALNAEISQEIARFSGPRVYLDGLILSVTQDISQIEVKHHDRLTGEGAYSLGRSISLWMTMATSFSIAPLRMASLLGAVFSVGGLFLAIYLVVQRMGSAAVVSGWTSLMVAFLIISGVQLIALGAIGEYLGRVFLTVNQRSQSVISACVNIDGSRSAGIVRPDAHGSHVDMNK